MRILFTFLNLALLCIDASATHHDVYILAGQSNMDGRGRASDLTEAQRDSAGDSIIFYRSVPVTSHGWQPLAPGFSVPPKFKDALPSPTFGPELGFAHAMRTSMPNAVTSAVRLAIIKGSKGGTSLQKDWNPGHADNPESQGPRYRDLIETVRLATNDLQQRGDAFTIRGLLWHQGESDSRSSTQKHQQRLTQFVARLREDLQLADLPIVLGQVHDNGRRDSVRQAIQAVANSDHTIGLVSSDGLTTWDEGTHFDAASQWEMGRRFAEQMRSIQAADSSN